MLKSKGYAALSAAGALVPFAFERREQADHDVTLEILYCGICHSDLSFVNNEWGISLYPMVPGHEIVGRVTSKGSRVSKFAVGDLAAVGCYVDTCRRCAPCTHGLEQMCVEGVTPTYSGYERQGGMPTFGGYSTNYVADEAYVLRVPPGLDPARAAPLLCAGITTYSPLRRCNMGPGHRVGVIGLGGLGHLGIKLAKSMGCEITLFTTSKQKAAAAIELGAAEAVVSTDTQQMTLHRGRFDFILDTVSAGHDLNAYMALLRNEGTLCVLGAPAEPLAIHSFSLLMGRKTLIGSNIGGIPETQEMLDYCGAHGLGADIEVISPGHINEAFARLHKHDVRYRFVIDMATL